jgi:hypothetical protein
MRRLLFAWWVILICVPLVSPHAQMKLGCVPNQQATAENLAALPLCFTENRGQWDEKDLFKAEAGGATFWFCRDEVVYQFTRDTDQLIEDGMSHGPDMPAGMPNKFNHPRYKKESMVLRVQFMGVNPDAEIMTDGRLSHNNNYFIGNIPSKWATDVPNYSSITYKDIYAGIDLTYHGDGKGMKYDFIVNPGSDISKIRIKYDGVDDLDVTIQGDLEAQTRFGPVYERIPQIYQEIDGQKRGISGHYILRESGTFGFALEDGFNPVYQVVIDPELVYSTYLGGNNDDFGEGIAVDGSGNAYVTGDTYSSDFPTVNPYDGSLNDSFDVFIAKLNSAGNAMLYSTYLGGSADDRARGIAVDGSGNTYVTGFTHSSNFPTVNPYGWSLNGSCDVFVAKLNAAGNDLSYSTYLGGSSNDGGLSISIDNSGQAFVTGYTYSSDFPMVNPYDGSFNGSYDVFATKLNAAGNNLSYSTYLGGNSNDAGYGITVDGSGQAYVTGFTGSYDFPTVNPYEGSKSALYDVFVTKLSSTGNSLIYSTFLGGSNYDEGNSIAVDDSGQAYVTGFTASYEFPMVNPYDGSWNGGTDAFAAKFNSAGNNLLYSTYLGGINLDAGYDIAVDNSGQAHVTGVTSSSDFPIQNPFQTYQESNDAFMIELSLSGNSLIYSTYLGGSNNDYCSSVDVDSSGNVYMTGSTNSSDFPTTLGAFDISYNGGYDVFVVKFGTETGTDDIDPMPSAFSLSQNYPNPFNAQTTIRFSLSNKSMVSIDIFDILGRKIKTLAEGIESAGDHQEIWHASGQSSGIYFYRIRAGDFQETKRMLLLK